MLRAPARTGSRARSARGQQEAGDTSAPCAEIEVTRAESQVYASQQDLVISQTNLLQQEIVLKNALSRNGVASPTWPRCHVIPLDTNLARPGRTSKPAEELVQEALGNRVEVAQGRLNIDSNRLNLVGIKSSLKPTLQAFAELTNNGLTGELDGRRSHASRASPTCGRLWQLAGADLPPKLSQLLRGVSHLNIPLRNRAAQSDYVTSQLELRQNELTLKRTSTRSGWTCKTP